MVTGKLRWLRAGSITLVILAMLFNLMHWPFGDHMLIIAGAMLILTILLRSIMERPLELREIARDLLTVGLLTSVALRAFHLPGQGYALGLIIASIGAVLWFDRKKILPAWSRKDKPILFSSALILVLTGIFFRILHWAYSSSLILAGLFLCVAWFMLTRTTDKE
jgi:hypothetical protein